MVKVVRVQGKLRRLRSRGRIRVRRPTSKRYVKRVYQSKMRLPSVKRFAKRQGLKADRSLKRGGSGTYRSRGRYLVYGKGRLKVRKRRR